MSEPQAVARAYANAHCEATLTEMDGETRYRTMHAHRCNGEHGSLLGVKIHYCACGAEFYFLEDMLSLVVEHLQERENAHEVTGIATTEREFIGGDGEYFTESYTDSGPRRDEPCA